MQLKSNLEFGRHGFAAVLAYVEEAQNGVRIEHGVIEHGVAPNALARRLHRDHAGELSYRPGAAGNSVPLR